MLKFLNDGGGRRDHNGRSVVEVLGRRILVKKRRKLCPRKRRI
jgi:hypothetical protein